MSLALASRPRVATNRRAVRGARCTVAPVAAWTPAVSVSELESKVSECIRGGDWTCVSAMRGAVESGEATAGGNARTKQKRHAGVPRPSPTYPRTHFPFFPPVPFSLYPQGGKAVVELAGKKLLVAKDGDTVYCSSNKCSHLGISLQGKTPLLQAEVKNGCVTCSAHGTVFRLSDGAVQGEWCPKLPNLPIVGKGPKEAPLPVYPARVSEAGMVEVDV